MSGTHEGSEGVTHTFASVHRPETNEPARLEDNSGSSRTAPACSSRLRLRDGEAIVVGIAEVVSPRILRHSPWQIKHVLQQALAARMLANRLMERLTLVPGHREDILRADQAGETNTAASRSQESVATVHIPFLIIGRGMAIVFSFHLLLLVIGTRLVITSFCNLSATCSPWHTSDSRTNGIELLRFFWIISDQKARFMS